MSGLLDTVVDFNGTVFAPTNEAFEAALKLLGIGATPELTDGLKAAIATVLVRCISVWPAPHTWRISLRSVHSRL